jgi:poly-beta-1,6-N-acetyl-D-glucosamine synthase
MPLLIITGLLFIFYTIIIIYFWQSWKAIPVFQATPHSTIAISVIIPARNEENNISGLLSALQLQQYPKELIQIIVVDDNSDDNTATIVQSFANITLIQLKEKGINSYKKKAIEKGIAAASGQLIVCTDADCLPPPNWLQTIVAFKEECNAVFIAAPVNLSPVPPSEGLGGLLYIFQALDFMILQGITGAGVYKKKLTMCNGANLAYEKHAFENVNGFEGIDTIASGDDMLLMYKIWKQNPDGVRYLKSKEAIVNTQAAPTWVAFINQRIRWASKASKYEDKRIFWVLLLVYLFNLSFLVMIVMGYWWQALLLIATKTLIELPFVISVARFFNQQQLLKYFLFFQPLHILYTIISGLFGQFGKYEWKGRKVR